jgi:hypothetical protein
MQINHCFNLRAASLISSHIYIESFGYWTWWYESSQSSIYPSNLSSYIHTPSFTPAHLQVILEGARWAQIMHIRFMGLGGRGNCVTTVTEGSCPLYVCTPYVHIWSYICATSSKSTEAKSTFVQIIWTCRWGGLNQMSGDRTGNPYLI